MLDTTIRPSDIDTSRNFDHGMFTGAFQERTANFIVRFLQAQGTDAWVPFDKEHFQQWAEDQHTGHIDLDDLGEHLLSQDEDTGDYQVTAEFVTQCFKGSGQLHREGPPTGPPMTPPSPEDTSWSNAIGAMAKEFAVTTAGLVRDKLLEAGCPIRLFNHGSPGSIEICLIDTKGEAVTLELMYSHALSTTHPFNIAFEIEWENNEDTSGPVLERWAELSIYPGRSPQDAANIILNSLRRWRFINTALGLMPQVNEDIPTIKGDGPPKDGYPLNANIAAPEVTVPQPTPDEDKD